MWDRRSRLRLPPSAMWSSSRPIAPYLDFLDSSTRAAFFRPDRVPQTRKNIDFRGRVFELQPGN